MRSPPAVFRHKVLFQLVGIKLFNELFSVSFCALHGMADSIYLSNVLLACLMTLSKFLIVRINVIDSCQSVCSVQLGFFCIPVPSRFSVRIFRHLRLYVWQHFIQTGRSWDLRQAHICPSGVGFFGTVNRVNQNQDPDNGRSLYPDNGRSLSTL